MKHVIDPEGQRLPIKIDTTSNGEFVPVPLSPANLAGNRLAHEAVWVNAKRLGMSRRDFLVSACGAASTLLAFNAANAVVRKLGGFFDIESEAALESQLAQARVGGKGEFIFDVQGHFVDPTGAWVKTAPADAFKWSPKAGCGLAAKPGALSYLNCLGPEEFVKDVFLDSDTDMMVLSFVPSRRDAEPLTIQAADAVRRSSTAWRSHRLLIHGRVNPNQPVIGIMDELKERWKVSAWKCYTQWALTAGFFSLTISARALSRRRRAGVKVICVHKGLPFGKQSHEHSQCSDIGVVAKRFPDVVSGLSLGFRHGRSGARIHWTRRERRHRHADPFTDRERCEAEQQRLRRARQHLALSHARAHERGARARQAPQVLRRKQCALGHRLHLVRIAARSDTGVSHFPDRSRTARNVWLSRDHAGAAREDIRA
jgi:hypothetical protein